MEVSWRVPGVSVQTDVLEGSLSGRMLTTMDLELLGETTFEMVLMLLIYSLWVFQDTSGYKNDEENTVNDIYMIDPYIGREALYS